MMMVSAAHPPSVVSAPINPFNHNRGVPTGGMIEQVPLIVVGILMTDVALMDPMAAFELSGMGLEGVLVDELLGIMKVVGGACTWGPGMRMMLLTAPPLVLLLFPPSDGIPGKMMGSLYRWGPLVTAVLSNLKRLAGKRSDKGESSSEDMPSWPSRSFSSSSSMDLERLIPRSIVITEVGDGWLILVLLYFCPASSSLPFRFVDGLVGVGGGSEV